MATSLSIFSLVPRTILILLLGRKNIILTDIMYYTKFSYGQISKSINFLEENGYVSTMKDGRERICTLTEKGKASAEWLRKLRDEGNL